MVKNKEGKLLTKEGEVKVRWQEHFTGVLNRPVPKVATEVEETDVVNNSIDIQYSPKIMHAQELIFSCPQVGNLRLLLGRLRLDPARGKNFFPVRFSNCKNFFALSV